MTNDHKGRILAAVLITILWICLLAHVHSNMVGADSDTISFPIVHAGTEVDSIVNVDFVAIHNDKCLGLTYNDNGWTVEYILGEYTIERVNNMVDFSDIIGCKRIS